MPINPWKYRDEPTDEVRRWEALDLDDDGPSVKRLRIPGGWIYLVGKHPPVFIPE